MNAVLQILAPGSGCSLQDEGRPGWKRFGVPEGGVMDRDSAVQANRLAGNPDGAPVLEIFLAGTRLKVLRTAEFALTGAAADAHHPQWRSFRADAGEEIALAHRPSGVWSYLAVHGGFLGPSWFGSVSVNPRAGFGTLGAAGDLLQARASEPTGPIASRFTRKEHQPRFEETPGIPIWPGPEWELFSTTEQERFLNTPWIVSPQSDRSGYRLDGPPLAGPEKTMLSSPLAVGTIQLPPAGRPIVILRDGPTVGGYPRLAIVEPDAVSRFTQCAPGTTVRFEKKA